MQTLAPPDMHILLHNGTITVKSPTGEHRTFRLKTQPDDSTFAPGKRILSVLTGPDNTRNYTPFAFVDRNVRIFKKKRDTTHIGYVRLLLNQAHYEALGFEYIWAARCRKCDRKLTTPESLASGIGPVCASR